MDDLVEDVIKALASGKHLENTYIIFSSDNGFHLGNCDDHLLSNLIIVLTSICCCGFVGRCSGHVVNVLSFGSSDPD